jgi:Kef-type K+ transport system membrane component KefB
MDERHERKLPAHSRVVKSLQRAEISCPMRWLASFFALTVTMMVLHRVTAAAPLEARATLALGFLVLAAHLGGTLTRRLRLPRITVWLLIGLCVGPAWLGIVRADEVRVLGFLVDAALALVAFVAGTRLQLGALRREGGALARAAAGSIVFPFLFVAAVMLSVSPWFPLTVHQPFRDAATVALVLGAIAAASSPVLVMAVADDAAGSGAAGAGPLARSVLRVSIAKDVAAILLLGLVLVVGQAVSSAGTVHLAAAGTLLLRSGASLIAGGLLGVGLVQFGRLVARGAVLLVSVAFITAACTSLLALEPLLVAMAAGAVVANTDGQGADRLVATWRPASRFVYLALFAVVGAALRLDRLNELWPWIALLAGLRGWGLVYGMRWAGKSATVAADLARYGWLGFISQAGVAVSLAGVARRAFPEWGVSLETLIVAMIGVHEVVGPICFKLALARAGEVTGGDDVTSETGAGGGVVAAARGGV